MSRRIGAMALVFLLLLQWLLPMEAVAHAGDMWGGVLGGSGGGIEESLGSPSDVGEGLEPTATPTDASKPLGDALKGPRATCPFPFYCQDLSCTCAATGGAACICSPTDLCYAAVTSSCVQPARCEQDPAKSKYPGTVCACATQGAGVCICTAECGCNMPNVTVATTTRLNDVATSTDAAGEVVQVTVNATLSCTEALFKEVRIKTYLEMPLELSDIHLIDEYKFESETTETVDGKTYTVVTVTTDAVNFSGQYSFEARFPAGLTANDATSHVFTSIEAIVTDGQPGPPGWNLARDDNVITGATAIAKAEADWGITLTTAELDYKASANDDNIFRYQVDLNRAPPAAGHGTIYMHESSSVTVDLLAADPFFPIPHGLEILRVTKSDGTIIPSTDYEFNPVTGKIVITAKNLGMGFTEGSGQEYSNNDKGQFFVVFKFSDAYYTEMTKSENMVPIGGGFFHYKIKAEAELDFALADGTTGKKAQQDYLHALEYKPGGVGGPGVFHKDAAKHFVPGYGFFDYATHLSYTGREDITYTVSFVNRTNTPLTDLEIVDMRPTMIKYALGAMGPVDGAVPMNSVYFSTLRIASWNGGDPTFVVGDTAKCVVDVYRNAVFAEMLPINGDGTAITFTTPTDITKLVVRVVGETDNPIELQHDFKLSLHIGVAGDDALAMSTMDSIRNQINFVENTASFTSKSAKDQSQTVEGSSTTTVHVYPFVIEKKTWHLEAFMGTSAATQAVTTMALDRGRDVYYKLVVYADNAGAHAYSPVFYIEVPPEISLDTTFAPILTGSLKDVPLALTHVGPNPFASGEIYKLEAGGTPLLNPAKTGTWDGVIKYGLGAVTIKGKLLAEASAGSLVTQKAYFGIKDPMTTLDESGLPAGYKTIDQLESGFTPAGQGLREKGLSIKVAASGKLEGEIWVQSELDRDTNAWHRHPEITMGLPGGMLNYEFVVRNGGDKKAENIVLYNVFAHKDDGFIIGNGNRKSEWQPYLTGPVVLEAGIAPLVSVYYSESSNHRVSTNGQYTGADDWTLTPYDYPSVQAIKLVFDPTFTLSSGAEVRITVPMNSPIDYNFAVGTDHLAISSLATQFNFEGESLKQALEPLKVTVKLQDNTRGEISGMVWGDVDQNGDQEPTEYPSAAVRVQLWKQGGTQAYLERVTDIEGKYKFTNLDDGTFFLRVIPLAGYTGVTAQGKNKFTPGADYQTTSNITIAVATREHIGIDAALHMPTARISGKLWQSLDGESRRHATRDEMLSGVITTLYRLLGQGKKTQVGFATASDASGAYSFSDVPAGRYQVEFTMLENHTAAKRVEDTTPGAPSYADENQGKWVAANPPAAPKPVMHSYDIHMKGTDVSDVDGGMVPAKGSIAGNIWGDLNGNSVKDGAEAGLAAISLTLTQTAGADASATRTAATNSAGDYLFEGLLPGTYTVTFADTTGPTGYYVSSNKGAARLEAARGQTADIVGLRVIPQDGDAALHLTGNDMGLVKTLVISGRIYNDKNFSNTYTLSDDGKLQSDNTIALERAAGAGGDGLAVSQTTATVAADDDQYTFTVWPGTYTLAFPANCVQGSDTLTDYDDYLTVKSTVITGARQFDRATRVWTLPDCAGDVSSVDLALTRPRTIAGMAWHDLDGGGTLDIAESQIARDLTLGRVGMTDVSGNATALSGYTFAGLYPGTYTIACDLTNVPPYVVTNSTLYNGNATDEGLRPDGVLRIVIPALDAGVGSDPVNQNFGVALPTSITGQVWHDKSLDSSYESNGTYDATDTLVVSTGFVSLYRWDGAAYTQRVKNDTGGDLTAVDSAGQYVFGGLIPGRYQVRIAPSATQYYRIKLTTTNQSVANPTGSNGDALYDVAGPVVAPGVYWKDIVLFSGESSAGMNAAVGEYATITGKLWHDLNGDGSTVGDSAYTTPPMPAMDVKLERSVDGTNYTDTETVVAHATDGTYQFGKLLPGAYKVSIKQGGARVTNIDMSLTVDNTSATVADRYATWAIDHNQTTSQTYADHDYLLSSFGKITGTVWVDKDGNAEKDAGESSSALAPAKVTLSYQSGPYATWFGTYPTKVVNVTVGDAYTFGDLWPGTYKVTLSFTDENDYIRTNASGDTGVTQTGANDKEWTVKLASSYANVADFGLVVPSKLSGVVWHDADNSKAKNGAEALTGSIRLVRQTSGAELAYDKTVTDVFTSSGLLFEGIFPGTYTATITALQDMITYYNPALTVASGSGSVTVTPHSSAITSKEKVFTVVVSDTLGTGIVATLANFGYVDPSTITSMVYEDLDNSGTKEVAEAGVASAPVLHHSTDGGTNYAPYTGHVVYSEAGNVHTYAELLPGLYRIVNPSPTGKLLTTADGTAKAGAASKASAAFNRPAGVTAIEAAGVHWNIAIPTADAIALETGVIMTVSKISGVIWKDLDADGSQGAGEPRATESLTVKLYAVGSLVALRETTTDVITGAYAFANLHPGSYRVEVATKPSAATWYVTNTGIAIKTNPWEKTGIALAYGGQATQNFGLTQPVRLAGKVQTRTYSNSVPQLTPVASATVSLYGQDGITWITTATTGADGSYAFDDLLAGAYQVQFNDAAYTAYLLVNTFADVAGTDRYQIFERSNRLWKAKLLSDDGVTNCDFVLSNKSVVYGSVWQDDNGDGAKDASENAFDFPASGVVANLYQWNTITSAYVWKKDVTVASGGDFFFSDLDHGEKYKVELTFPADHGLTNAGPITTAGTTQGHYEGIDVTTAGQEYGPYVFGLAKYVQISGLSFTELDGNGAYNVSSVGDLVLPSHGIASFTRNGTQLGLATATDMSGEVRITLADCIFPGSFGLVYAAYPNHTQTVEAVGLDPAARVWNFSLVSGGVKGDVNVGFTPYRKIEGTIWQDANGDGVLDGAETKLGGKIVRLYKHNGTRFVLVSTAPATNNTGYYSFDQLLLGRYKVELTNPTAGDLRTNASAPLALTQHFEEHIFGVTNPLSATIDLGYVAPVTLSGRAYIDKDSNGQFGAVDAGAVVSVNIVHTATGYATTRMTQADGTFSVAGLPGGDYTVVFSGHPVGHAVSNAHADFNPLAASWSVAVPQGTTNNTLDIGYKSTAYRLTGIVWKDDDGNGLQEGGEAKFSTGDGIQISFAHGSYLGIANATLDGNGAFSVAVPGPGAYTIRAISLPAGYTITNRLPPYDRASDSFSQTLSYDRPTGHVEIGAAHGQEISGMLFVDDNADGIMGAGESPLRAQVVELLDEDGFVELATTTDMSGGYSFFRVKPGLYTVRLRSLSNYCFTGNNDRDAPSPMGSDFDLRKGNWTLRVGRRSLFNVNSGYCTAVKVEAVLFDETLNAPVAGENAELWRYDAVMGSYVLWLNATTDIDGGVVFDQLLPGLYQIIAHIPAGYEKNPETDGEMQEKSSTIKLEVDLSSPGAAVAFSMGIFKGSLPSEPFDPPSVTMPAPLPTPAPAGTAQPPISVPSIPQIGPNVPNGSFVDADGNVLVPPAQIQLVDPESGLYVETTQDGTQGRYWRKVQLNGKTIYVLVDDFVGTVQLPKTGDAPKVNRLAGLLLLGGVMAAGAVFVHRRRKRKHAKP